jgi:hypothetical protein
MANFTVSPGITLNEIDQTYLSGQPVQVGAAIIGPTVKGPVEIPTVVSSYSEYQNIFGDTFTSGSDVHSYFTSMAAYNYFNYGGSSLLVARVVSGSYTAATSSLVSNSIIANMGNTASISINASTTMVGGVTGSFTAIRINTGGNDYWIAPNNAGVNLNSNALDYYYTSSGAATNNNYDNYMSAIVSTINDSTTDFKNVVGITASYSSPNIIIKAINGGTTLNGVTIYNGTYIGGLGGTLIGTLAGGTGNTSSNTFTLETISEGILMNNYTNQAGGSLLSGSKDNIRYEITLPNTASGTFNVVVRRGDDITNKKVVLESFNGVTLDPNSPRFISKVIGDQKLSYDSVNNQMDLVGNYPNASRFIRVKSVDVLTPNYLDPLGQPRSQYTSSLPLSQSGSFGDAAGDVKNGANLYENINASNTQGLVAANYSNMINLLSNTEAYKFKVLSTPGLTNDLHTSAISNLINNTQLRGDNIYILDLTVQSGTIADAITQAQSRDNSYAATYWPWVNFVDPGTGKSIWAPASTLIPGVYANNDKISAPWFAPAGINRGGLNNVQRAKLKLSSSNKDDLYTNNINPLATMPKHGVVAFGNKTLQKDASALDRVNVRRLLIEL